MGWSEDDDYKNWNPRKFWAEENNEQLVGPGFGKSDLKVIEKLIRYMAQERTIAEILQTQHIKRGEILRYFSILRDFRGISIERRNSKGCFSYRIIDFRK